MMLAALFLLDDGTAVLVKGKGFHVHKIYAGHMVRPCDPLEGLRRMYEDAFLLGLLDFFIIGCHHVPCLQAGQMNLLRAQTFRRPRTVKCHVSAAQYNDSLSDAGFLSHACVAQEIRVQHHALQVISFHGKSNPFVSADGHQHRVVFLEQVNRLFHLCIHFDLYARRFDHCCFLRNDLPGQTVGRDSVRHHAADRGERFL